MLLIPDPDTAVIDPFRAAQDAEHQLLRARPGHRRVATRRDPRYIAKKAEDYLHVAPASPTPRYFGPEAEFFIFDDVRFDQNQHSATTSSTRSRASWNSGARRAGPNLGYKPRYKEGYFPVPPMDQYQDLRSEMVARRSRSVGIEIEVQHHEVGTARPGRDRHALRHAAARWPTS